jgi:hypothetical protein
VEHHFNAARKSDPHAYELMRLIPGEIFHLGRMYLTVSGSYLIHTLVTSTAASALNLNDGSRLLALLAGRSAGDHIDISLGG